MPIIGMMELIRQKIISCFYDRRINGETSKARIGLVNGDIKHEALVGYAEKFIRESIQRGRLYRILPSTNDVFEIHTPKHIRIVYVDKKICTAMAGYGVTLCTCNDCYFVSKRTSSIFCTQGIFVAIIL